MAGVKLLAIVTPLLGLLGCQAMEEKEGRMDLVNEPLMVEVLSAPG